MDATSEAVFVDLLMADEVQVRLSSGDHAWRQCVDV
jgi:hypothetical protein